MRIFQFALVSLVLAGCGSNIEKEPQTVYVVVNNSAGTNSGTNGTNGTNGNNTTPAPNNTTPTPNNAPDPANNSPDPVNNTPQPTNNTPEPTNNTPTPTNNMPSGDACNNEADLTSLLDNEMPYVTRDCAVECLQASDSNACTADCVAMTSGVSEPCSLCIADLSECGVAFCLSQCIEDPYTSECVACLELECEDDFVACAGVPSR